MHGTQYIHGEETVKIFEEGFKQLGVRFFLIGLLPSTFLAAVVAAVADPTLVLRWLSGLSTGDAQWSFLSTILAGAVLITVLLESVQLPMTRLLEGYWPEFFPINWIMNRRADRYRQKLEKLKKAQDISDPNDAAALRHAQNAAFAVHQLYPADPHRVMPTRLGNILRAGEDTVCRLYGLDAVVVWPRLYPLLSSETRSLVSDQRMQLDLTIRLTYIFAAAASVVAIGLFRQSLWWTLGVILLIALSFTAYRACQAAALNYVTLFQTAFDLHRHVLYKTMRIELAADIDEERKQNRILSRFLREGVGNLKFASPQKNAKDESQG